MSRDRYDSKHSLCGLGSIHVEGTAYALPSSSILPLGQHDTYITAEIPRNIVTVHAKKNML